ncbi:MAG: efflux RND transporter permease subunit [Bacteroidales bacterium]|nr:efflux RND transporter permease subunit [Bacteroidales bacterium]
MIDNIIRFSLTNRLVILVGAIMMILGGIYSTDKMDIDVFPDLTAPTVVVMTDASGLTAEEVERMVTFPIETAINGATNVRRVRSASLSGNSFVWAEFDWGMDVFKARQIVSEKMVALGDVLPEGVTPVLAPQSSVMGEILFVGLQADSTSMMDLRTLAEWVIKPSILATGGVSQVTIIGGDYKEYQIVADPLKMSAYGVTMDELSNAGRTMSQNSSGGVVRDYSNEFSIRGMGRSNDIDDLGATFIKMYNGNPVAISDVAEIRIGAAMKMGHASQNAKPAVLLSVSKQPNINTLKVTEQIEANLKDIQKSLPADVKLDSKIFRQADFIEASISNVGRALLEGAVFVIIVLFLFLGSFRTTVISVIAIPLSLFGSFIALYALGMDINTMTLGGMCIAIGSLVDDAIIDVENVYKRLREQHKRGAMSVKETLETVFHASKEIRTSIMNATFIIMVAFVPLFFLSGMEGRMLKPLGIAYIIALFMSLIVAMTATPLLCNTLLTSEKYLSRNEKDSKVVAWLNKIYGRALTWTLNHSRTIGIATAVLFIAAIGLFSTMGSSFLPDFNEGSMTISAVTKPGVSLDVSNELGNMMEKTLLEIPEVKTTSRRTGRGELDEHSQATNSAEIDVNFTLGDRSREEVFNDVRARLNAIPGVAVTVGQPLGHRIDHILSGTQANIAIKLFGTDISRMFMIGNQIKAEISDIEGCVDVAVEQQVETPQIQIRPKRTVMARYGITMEDFNEFVGTAFSGAKLGDIYEGQRSFDLTIRLRDEYTQSIEGIKNALIDTENGKKVALSEIADIISTGGPNTISRENVQRKLVVSANVSGRDISSVVEEIQSTLEDEIELPEGYRIEYGGQFESAKSAQRTLAIATIASLIVIFLLLLGEFKKLSLAALVMCSLPLALIGGVFAVWITSGVVSIPATIGFITLLGIATRNGVLLISKYENLSCNTVPLNETIITGSIDRLNPILMTALTSALALIPLVLNGDKSGNEIQSPMAIVVLGGLLTSTMLNIFVMPIIYRWYKNNRQ